MTEEESRFESIYGLNCKDNNDFLWFLKIVIGQWHLNTIILFLYNISFSNRLWKGFLLGKKKIILSRRKQEREGLNKIDLSSSILYPEISENPAVIHLIVVKLSLIVVASLSEFRMEGIVWIVLNTNCPKGSPCILVYELYYIDMLLLLLLTFYNTYWHTFIDTYFIYFYILTKDDRTFLTFAYLIFLIISWHSFLTKMSITME